MKKKLLLIALPALMVLSGCANVQKDQPKVEEQPAAEFVEDTVAHEELFGPAKVQQVPGPKKMPNVDTQDDYKIGYQLHYDSVEDELSIRFVAAINAEYSQMRWSRGFSRGDGSETKPYTNEKTTGVYFDSTEVYTSLSNGGEDAIEATEGVYAGYTGFIVYSMTNIPYELYKDSYIVVSLVLHPALGDDVVTPIYAVKIETNNTHTESVHKFSFNPNVNTYNGYFLQGTINGTEQVLAADNPTIGDNNASYTNLDLLNTDSFASFYFKDSSFKYFSCEQHDYSGGGDEWSYFDESSSYFNTASGGFVVPKKSDKHALFISSGNANHVYSTIYGDDVTYTVTDTPEWVRNDVDLFACVIFAGEPETSEWVAASVSGSNIVFEASNLANRFLVVRCPKGTTTPNWSTTGDASGRIYNKTDPDFDITFGYFSFSAPQAKWANHNP